MERGQDAGLGSKIPKNKGFWDYTPEERAQFVSSIRRKKGTGEALTPEENEYVDADRIAMREEGHDNPYTH